MSPQEFTPWFDEMLRFSKVRELDAEQTALVKGKLDSVFNKVTPVLTQFIPSGYSPIGTLLPNNVPIQHCGLQPLNPLLSGDTLNFSSIQIITC